MEPRRGAIPGRVDEQTELTYLRAGSDPPWERPHADGIDVTDDPTRQTPYQRQRRAAFEERVRGYRERGLLD